MGLLLRGTVLFMIGNFFAVFMNLLQINRQGDVSVKLPPELLENLFLKEWWVPPMCGAAAGNTCVLSLFYVPVKTIHRKKKTWFFKSGFLNEKQSR